jgi:hypothetical protein
MTGTDMMICPDCNSYAHKDHKCVTATESGFIKHDSGKNMLSLIDPDFVLGIGEILTFGAAKYEKNNWQKNTDLDRYKDSTLRHMYAYLNGELIDPESGKPHLDHIATNIMFLRYFEHGKGIK